MSCYSKINYLTPVHGVFKDLDKVRALPQLPNQRRCKYELKSRHNSNEQTKQDGSVALGLTILP